MERQRREQGSPFDPFQDKRDQEGDLFPFSLLLLVSLAMSGLFVPFLSESVSIFNFFLDIHEKSHSSSRIRRKLFLPFDVSFLLHKNHCLACPLFSEKKKEPSSHQQLLPSNEKMVEKIKTEKMEKAKNEGNQIHFFSRLSLFHSQSSSCF